MVAWNFEMEKFGIKFWEKLNILRIPKVKIVDYVRGKWLDALIFIPISLYAVIFSHYTILKHYTFNSYAWDLGIFNQALYTTLYHGKLLFSTAELFMQPSGSYLATHFSPILFTLLPFYALYPSAENLLVIKSSVLALGALPLYFLVKETLKSRKAAFILAIAYLLHPAIQGSNWFDFQQQIFLPILMFSSSYFMIKERWRAYFATTVLSLMISEHATLVVLALSIYYLLTSNVRRIPSLIKALKITRETAMVLTLLMCFISLFVAEYVKGLFPIQPEFMDVYKATDVYKVLGFKGESLISLPIYLLLNPDKSLNALLYDYHIKLIYIVFLFAPLAFLPFGSKITIFTFALLLPFLVSNYSAYYKIGAHYPLYVIAPIFLAAIEALSNRTKRDIDNMLKIIMITSLIFIVSISPISPASSPLIKAKILWYPTSNLVISGEIEAMHKMLDLIPRNASILTQNHIFPHVSSRINAYVLPIYTEVPEQKRKLENYVRDLINRSEYIFLDIRQKSYWIQFVFNEILNNGTFGPYKFTKSAILFKRDYFGPSQLIYAGNETTFPAENLYLNFGKILRDESSESGNVAFCPKGSRKGIFLYGPYIFLPNGVYNVTWTIKANGHSEEYLAAFEVSEGFGEKCIARRDLYGFDIEPNVWNNITVSFAVSKTKVYVEFRVYSTGAADIYVDRVILKQVSGEAENEFATRTFNYRDLKVNGKITGEGFLLYSAESGENIWSFWYGPYISLPPGKYRVTFNLRVEPTPEMEDRVIRLEVVKNHGADIILSVDVNGRNITENISASKWCEIKLEFDVETLIEEVEFRGVDPSRKYNIYLAYVLLEKNG